MTGTEVVQEATQEAQEIANQETTEAAQNKTATDESGTEPGSQEKDTQADERKFTQSELDDIIKKRIAKATAIAERKASKAYAEKLESLTRQPQAQHQEAKQDGKPQLSQFERVEDYVEAVADWKLQAREQAQARQSEEQKVKQFQSEIQAKAQSVFEKAEEDPEFDNEAFEHLPVSEPMAYAIMDSELAPKLMVYLTKNPDEVDRIGKLSPARQAAEIGKLEVKLTTKETKEVKVSKAPAPIDPIGNKGSSSKDPSDMTDAEFATWRRRQIAQRR